jgi:hypothetical protein
MDGLVIILILIVMSAAANWLKRRGQSEETEIWPDEAEPGDQSPTHRRAAPPDAPATPPRPARSSWEEELRRLLEGETPRRPEPKPAPTPPPVRPVVITPSKPVPAPPPLTTAAPASGRARTIGQTAVALGRARELQRRAADDFRRAQSRIGGRPLLSAMERRRDRSEEIRRAREWFSNPQAARQAVIASVILGPPRAVAPSDNVPGMTPPDQ